MFDLPQGRSSIAGVIIAFVVQQWLATVGIMLVTWLLVIEIGSGSEWWDFVGAPVALYLGWSLENAFPRLAGTGCWVWVFPTVIWFWELVTELRVFPAREALSAVFLGTGEGERLEVLLLVFAVQGFAYSAGGWLAVRGRRGKGSPAS